MFLPVVPNWQHGVRATYEYRTDVFTSRSGKEKREAQRDTPRRRIEFTALPLGDDMLYLRDYALRLPTVEPWRIQDPTQPKGVLAAGAAQGASSLSLVAAPAWLAAADRICLVSGRTVEEVAVASVAGTSVTLDGTLGRSWGAGTSILPSVEGRLIEAPQMTFSTDRVGEWSVVFDVLPGSEIVTPADVEIALVLDGREVLGARPNWATRPDLTFQRVTEMVDYGRGRTAIFAPAAHGPRIRSALHTPNAEGVRALLDVFHRAKGRRGEFYEPTWTTDLRMTEDAAAGAMSIRVADPTLEARFGDMNTYRAIALVMKDRSAIYLSLAEISSGADYSDLVLDDELPVAVAAADVEMACWLPVKRFAADSLTVEWVTDAIANIVISTCELPYAPAEGNLPSNALLWLLGAYGEDFLLNDLFDPIDHSVNVTYPEITL